MGNTQLGTNNNMNKNMKKAVNNTYNLYSVEVAHYQAYEIERARATTSAQRPPTTLTPTARVRAPRRLNGQRDIIWERTYAVDYVHTRA
jgi:hypothetical protein